MYTEFYDLREKPFDLSPSSKFLYMGENHKEALALLTYGLRERMGFGLLTGEVGTGKTTIVRTLLADLDQNVHLVHLSNPLMSPREFLDYLARKALGRETPFLSKAEFLIDFETFLVDCQKSGKNFLLIVDETHKASFQLLEEIRLLSNMEMAEEKLMGVFLVGQPEFRERLKDPRCRALSQRITIHYHLPPLDQNATAEYILTRLRAAGSRTPDKIFQESVIRKIHQYSKGYPREINNISDNSTSCRQATCTLPVKHELSTTFPLYKYSIISTIY
jgi:type II secretory pathway predicted ATPase ExeA